MISRQEARTRVQRGAALLDRDRPGWFNRIDVGTLTLSDPCGCIVGQLIGNYDDCRQQLGLTWIGAVSCGLNITGRQAWDLARRPTRVWTLLQDAWIEAIADRRLSAAPNGTPAHFAVGQPTPDTSGEPIRV